jgi:FkbM family methyltransferase
VNYRTIEKFPFLNTLVNIQLDRIIGRKNVRTIIDIGAYDGTYCLYMSRLYKEAKIYAIEPSKQTFKLLKRNTSNCPNISRYRLLISDTNERGKLFVESKSKAPSQGNSVFADFMNKKQSVTEESVKSSTLSDFCKDNDIGDIDLLIMNCEGGEYKVFEHASSLLVFERVRILNLALHGKSKLFLSKEYTEKKKYINQCLTIMKFKLVYGNDLNGLDELPKGHIQQLWIRE